MKVISYLFLRFTFLDITITLFGHAQELVHIRIILDRPHVAYTVRIN